MVSDSKDITPRTIRAHNIAANAITTAKVGKKLFTQHPPTQQQLLMLAQDMKSGLFGTIHHLEKFLFAPIHQKRILYGEDKKVKV